MANRYRLTIPARINLLGNPADANEGDYAVISAAVDLHAGAVVEPADGLVLEILASAGAQQADHTRVWRSVSAEDFPLVYDGPLDLVIAALNTLFHFSPEFRDKLLSGPGVRFASWSNVPRQSGLGGSSLFVLLTLAGMRACFELDLYLHNDYILAELAQRAEAKELGITCGYADRYVPLFGGLAYVDYREKLHQKEIFEEPYATYERLDSVPSLPLVAVTTGIRHESGDVHGRMRPCYIEEHRRWMTEKGEPPRLIRLMQGAYETAWRGKIALLQNDLAAFGAWMNKNHQLVEEMMRVCGFEDGAGWANNLFIDLALRNGALGAKLTGAGSGGSVFALTRPGEEQAVASTWQRSMEEHGLRNAFIFQPNITRVGLKIVKEA